jgi:hypothetical protein
MTNLPIAIMIFCFIVLGAWGIWRRHQYKQYAERYFPNEPKISKRFYAQNPWMYQRVKNPELRKLHKKYNIEGAIALVLFVVILFSILAFGALLT